MAEQATAGPGGRPAGRSGGRPTGMRRRCSDAAGTDPPRTPRGRLRVGPRRRGRSIAGASSSSSPARPAPRPGSHGSGGAPRLGRFSWLGPRCLQGSADGRGRGVVRVLVRRSGHRRVRSEDRGRMIGRAVPGEPPVSRRAVPGERPLLQRRSRRRPDGVLASPATDPTPRREVVDVARPTGRAGRPAARPDPRRRRRVVRRGRPPTDPGDRRRRRGHARGRGRLAGSSLVLSEVQTGGASASDEFAEIANAGPSPVDLAGLELVYVTSTGTTVTRKATWAAPTVAGARPSPAHRQLGRHLRRRSPMRPTPAGFAATGGALVLRVVGGNAGRCGRLGRRDERVRRGDGGRGAGRRLEPRAAAGRAGRQRDRHERSTPPTSSSRRRVRRTLRSRRPGSRRRRPTPVARRRRRLADADADA